MDINENFSQMNDIDFIEEVDNLTAKDFEEAYRVLSSMLHKCKKAQEKLSKEKWQWKLMENIIRALEIALPIIINSSNIILPKNVFEDVIHELSSTLDKTVKIREKLRKGSSQWALNKNRIRALQIAIVLLSGKQNEKE